MASPSLNTNQPKPLDWRARLARLLGFNTLRGRYLFTAFILVSCLVLLATFMSDRVHGVSQENAANLGERQRVHEMVYDLRNDFWIAEQQLKHYLLQPSRESRSQFDDMLGHILVDMDALTRYAWVSEHPDEMERIGKTVNDLRALRTSSLRLMDIRIDPRKTFPAMSTMFDRMQPANLGFITAASLALDEAQQRRYEPGQSDAMQLFYDSLYSWTRMIDSFRMYTANRFGIFDTSVDEAMRIQSTAIEDYHERLQRNLSQLTQMNRINHLEFQQQESLATMKILHQRWYDAWRSVQTTWQSGRWRLDTHILQTEIEPLSARIWENFHAIESAVHVHSTEDVALLDQAARHLSGSLWMLAMLGLAAFGLLFLAFEGQIRRPIARVVSALRAEAHGQHDTAMPTSNLEETRDLIESFDAMRREVRARQERLQGILDTAAEAIITIDERGLIESFNPTAEKLFGYSHNEVIGKDVATLMSSRDATAHAGHMRRYQEGQQSKILGREREELARHKDGHTFPISLKVSEMHVGGRRLFTGMISDITERRAMIGQLEGALREINAREQRLHTILNNTAEGIITFDEHGLIEGFNQSAENLFGWKETDILGHYMTELVAPEQRETGDSNHSHFQRNEIHHLVGREGEVTGRYRDGCGFPMAIKVSAMMLDGKQKYIAMVSNISERKALMEHLRQLAERDGLTGLFNRRYFQEELVRVVDRVQRNESVHCALLYIDLDHFKFVNDTLGHAAGDKLLIEIAGILQRRVRKSDLVARLGGDEFTVLLYDTPPDILERVADSFRRHLSDYDFHHEGQSVTIGCSIGVAVFDKQVATPAEIMSRADIACHLAKRSGRNQVHVFNPADMHNVTSMTLDMGWSRRIREAIEDNHFTLAIQPIVSTTHRQAVIHEVLIRMRDTNGELIMPGGFLPTAERFGLSFEIDRWVIIHAMDALVAQRRNQPDLVFAINLSAQTLNTPSVSGLIQDRLQATGLDPAALIFEITETAAIADMTAAVELLQRLRTLGCRTALDDFGSGMSSFAYLQELPVDLVKIDGRFVRHIATNTIDQAMVRAMNDIAHTLGKQTIAEFVEDEATFQILARLGVDHVQGYHLGRPENLAARKNPDQPPQLRWQ